MTSHPGPVLPRSSAPFPSAGVFFLALLLALPVLACSGCGSSAGPSGDGTAGAGGAEAGDPGGVVAGEEAPGAGQEGRPVARRDDFATVEEWFASLERTGTGTVTVFAAAVAGSPAGGEAAAERPAALAAELAAAVEAMAPLVPLSPADLRETPLTVVIEQDHTQQILHAGEVGEAVAGGPADIHLVFHPDDGFAYRHALALALLRRAGLAEGRPPYLLSGAAWWLVEQAAGEPGERWYGRSRDDWLPRLAAAGALPTAGELLAAEEPPDGSRLLWTPVAAAVVAALPGETLAEKLAAGGGDGGDGGAGARFRAAVEAVLARAHPALRDASLRSALRDMPEGRLHPTTSAEEPAERASRSTGLLAAPTASTARDPLPPFLAGVSLAMLNDVHLGYQAPSVDAALVHLRRTVGANAVSLMPFAYQRRPDDPRLVYLNRRPRSETDAAMLHAGRRAQERGFTVLWKPQIWLSGSWPGEVEMRTEEDWQAWFRSYRRFLVHQAVLADRVGAEVFSVGVELGRTVDRQDDWNLLIDAVELFYDGPLTYAANWYGDFDRVPFWDRLDFLGMDAYQPLSEDPGAGDAALAAGARRVVGELEAAARRHGKPLLLTELGYAAHEAAWVAPHEEGGTYSPPDQARAYRAFLAALGKPRWLRGVFVWKAFSSGPPGVGDGARGTGNGEHQGDFADFRFLGRPAEEVIGGYFRASPGGGG